MLARKMCRGVPQAALCASIWCACLALPRTAFFADPIGVLFPLRFGEWMRLYVSSPHTHDMASHPSTSCATRPSPPAPASTRRAEVAFRAAGPPEKAPAGTDGRSRSSAVCGSASSQCKPLLGLHRSCPQSRPALLCFLARHRTRQRSRAQWEIGIASLSIVGWRGPRPKTTVHFARWLERRSLHRCLG